LRSTAKRGNKRALGLLPGSNSSASSNGVFSQIPCETYTFNETRLSMLVNSKASLNQKFPSHNGHMDNSLDLQNMLIKIFSFHKSLFLMLLGPI